MDGRNCTGRKISLLNEYSDVATALPSPNNISNNNKPSLQSTSSSYLTHHHSRASSCSSTPSLSPQTPHLVRSSSSDSRAFQTPSPLTPSFVVPFPPTQLPSINDNNATAHALQQSPVHKRPSSHAQHFYGLPSLGLAKMDDQTGSLYPPIPDATGMQPSAYPMPQHIQPNMPQLAMSQQGQMHHPATQAHMGGPSQQQQQQQQAHQASNSPSSEPSRLSTVSNGSNSKVQPKKNQYPCPLAKQFGCNDFFTTSGHAARHAKKHTGKKDAFCPECNKAFTRKDNMEQHRRTHQNGRGVNRPANGDDGKVKKPSKTASRKVSTKVEPQQLEAAVQMELAEQQAALMGHIGQGQPIMPHQIPQSQSLDAAMMIPPSPYYLGPGIDSGPVPSLPMAIQNMSRPSLQRNQFTDNLEYVAPSAPMLPEDAMHYSYPSPGLSNGLNSLALAASEHRRLSEEKMQPSSRSPSHETPSQETP